MLDLDANAQAQLRRLLGLLAREARTNGARPAPALVELAAVLSAASAGPERTQTEPDPEPGHDGRVLALDYDAAARQLDVSERTVRRLVASGQLQAITVGGRARRIPQAELERFVADRLDHPTPAA